MARHSCSCRKKNVRAPSIPEFSPRATSAPPSRRPIHRGRSTLSRRVGRWRKRARWVWRKLNAVPKALRIVVVAVTILAIFSATNLVYHVLRKPTEVFAPVSGAFNKTPVETWRQYAPLFREYSTAAISPELLAALAQVEAAGNPVASTYWRWRLTWNPFAIYQPASSSVGMYQMTDAAFAEARHYCIRDHVCRRGRLLVNRARFSGPTEPRHRAYGGVFGPQSHGDSRAPAKDGGQRAAEAGACRDNPSLRRKLGQGIRAPRLPSDRR